MAKREPLYPHVPSRTARFPHTTTTTVKDRVAGMPSGKVYIMAEDHPALPAEVPYPVLFKQERAVIDDIGHVTYLYFPELGVGHVEGISVAPSYQRQGFGTKLLQFALEDMMNKGITRVSASALSEAGEKLLKTFGFSYTGKGTFMARALED